MCQLFLDVSMCFMQTHDIPKLLGNVLGVFVSFISKERTEVMLAIVVFFI